MIYLHIIRLASALFFCVSAVGCSHTIDPDKPVSEFPAKTSHDYRARGDAILALCRWVPDNSPEAMAAVAAEHKHKTLERETLVQQVSIEDGQLAGFRRKGGDLFAIAGNKAIALPPGHYTWQLLSLDPRARPSNGSDADTIGAGALGVAGDSLKDEAASQDNKYNGVRRQEQNLPAPDLSK